jgi:hypothetical protein
MLDIKNVMMLFGMTIFVMVLAAILHVAGYMPATLAYTIIVGFGALWLPSPLHSQEVEVDVVKVSPTHIEVPVGQAKGMYPISEVREVDK